MKSPKSLSISAATPRWIEDKLRAGVFPGHKVGRRWVLTDEDVEEILQLCAVPTKSEQLHGINPAAPQGGSSMTVTTARRIASSSHQRGTVANFLDLARLTSARRSVGRRVHERKP
jgi:hypothetical protein